jgi:serine/threonine protein kinase/tetratricopeptide (TPR) repeat protein
MLCPVCQASHSPLAVRCQQCGASLASPIRVPASPHLSPPTSNVSSSLSQQVDPAQSFAPYQLVEKAGEGGMGVVYRAYDPRLCRFVALKVLRQQQAAFYHLQAQLEEARLLSSLQHPNIVTVFDISHSGSQPYIVTEWLEGQTLQQWLSQTAEPAAEAKPDAGTDAETDTGTSPQALLVQQLQLAVQMAAGISAAHQAGVIHRDLKPSNVMILHEQQQVKLLDFGMASREQPTSSANSQTLTAGMSTGASTDADRNAQSQPLLSLASANDWSQHTTQSVVKGTLPYLAPELLSAGAQASAASDIFSFGILLAEIFYRQHPFLRADAAATLQAIAEHQLLLVPVSSQQVPKALQQLIRQCLAPDASDRPASMALVWQQLHSLLQQQQRKLSLGRWYQFSRWQFWLPLVCLALLLMLWLGKASVGREDILGGGQTLALLPFENIGADPALDGFIKGLGLSLSHDLALLGEQNQDYWVIPAAEISQLKQPSVGALHRQFAVDLVLQGSVQHLGATRRLSLALVNASNNRVIRSTELDLPLNGWDQAQQQIRTAVLDLLQWQLPAQLNHRLSRGSATDDQAYQHYLTGLSLLYRYDYQNNLDKAVAEFQTAERLNPDFISAKVELNRAYLKLAKLRDFEHWYQLAKQSIEQLVAQYADVKSILLLQAELYLLKSEFEQATHIFNLVLAESPDNIQALAGLAVIYTSQGDNIRAEQTYQKILSIRDNWSIRNLLATFYYRTSQLDKAMEQYNLLSRISPENNEVMQTLGALQFAAGDADAALVTFKKALALAESGNNYSNIASVLFYQKKYTESVEYFEKAVELGPSQYLLWANLGDGYRWSGQQKKSVDSYQQAIQLLLPRIEAASGSTRLKLRLALYLAKANQCERSLQMARQIKKYQDVQMTVMAAQLFEVCEQRQDAVSLLTQALEQGYPLHSVEEEPEFHRLIKLGLLKKNVSRPEDIIE